MYAILGTVPDPDFPLIAGAVRLEKGRLSVGGRDLPIHRGTPALIAAAFHSGAWLGLSPPFAFLVGDTGEGDGSRTLYAHLEAHLGDYRFESLTFHYLQPDADWHNRVLFAVQAMQKRPILIADAGFMYAAKMSGQAEQYDLFTPDVGELAFLADEQAPHPFYTRGFILHPDQKAPELIRRAYAHHNAARHLLVKGQPDYVVRAGTILHTVDGPSVPALEAMGGTGDSLTGMATALIAAGTAIPRACLLAARANRLAGSLAAPTPATQIEAILAHIPQALETVGR